MSDGSTGIATPHSQPPTQPPSLPFSLTTKILLRVPRHSTFAADTPHTPRYDTSCRRNTTLHFLHFHNLIIDKLMMKKRVTTRHEFPSAHIEFSCCRTDNYSFRRSSIFRYSYLSLIAIESLLSWWTERISCAIYGSWNALSKGRRWSFEKRFEGSKKEGIRTAGSYFLVQSC